MSRNAHDDWRPNPRPNAFFVPITEDEAHLVDPDEPLVTGCFVVVKIDTGCYLPGVLVTKRPNRAKTLTVKLDDNGGVLRGIDKPDVRRVVSVSRRI
jgi:hypothetical protein